MPLILSVVYVAQVHSKERRFFVPKRVLKILKVNVKDSVALCVRKASGELVFCGIHEIVSGEIYGPKVSSLTCGEAILSLPPENVSHSELL
jgi:hypothetical protein